MSGIACAGNWVLDRSKFIDYYPEITNHTTIHHVKDSVGGAAANVLSALQALETDVATYGIGLISNHLRGKELVRLCQEKNLNMDFIKLVDEHASFTDAMTLPDGSRTQFHCPAVNDLLKPEDIPIDKIKAKGVTLFYLGHLTVLGGLDAADPEFGTRSAHLLKIVQDAGIETAIDIVSNPSRPYEELVLPALPYTDYLICNEFEATCLSQIKTSDASGKISMSGLHQAAEKLLTMGVQKAVVIHAPAGCHALLATGKSYYQPSLSIPADKIIASCGAGDAFCAGALYGIHQRWDMQECLKLAVCTAGASLMGSSNTGQIKPLAETLALAETWHYQTVFSSQQ